MAISKITQIALHVDDLERASAFYEQLLGYPPSAHFESPGLTFFTVGNTRLLLEPNAPSSLIYLQVENVRSTVDQLRNKVTIEGEPHVIFKHQDDSLGPINHDEWMAFIRDSENNLVGLVSHELSS